jgi:uncharacterized protein (UPF0332 family)
MVFLAAPAEERSEACAQAAWEASVQWGEQIAQLTYSLSDLIQPRSYLVVDTLQRGREIYSMEEDDIRRLEIDGLQRKAQNYLAQAEHASAQGDYELALVGADNVVELAAKALILLKPDLELPSSHGGMLQTFSREYIKTGEAPGEWGRQISRFLELRSRALSDTHAVIGEGETQPMIGLARSMIAFLQQKLG